MEPGRRPAGGAEDVVYCLYDGEADGGRERRGCVPTVGRRAARHRVIYMCVCVCVCVCVCAFVVCCLYDGEADVGRRAARHRLQALVLNSF